MRISLNNSDELSDIFKEIFGKGVDQKINGITTDKIGRAHVRTPVTSQSRMPSSA